MKWCDVTTNSLKQYHKECMKNSMGKMHVDVGASRVNNLPVYYFYDLTSPNHRNTRDF